MRGDNPTATFAVREIDLQNRFKYSPTELANKVDEAAKSAVLNDRHAISTTEISDALKERKHSRI